jgi:hypothetical protein
VQVKQVAGSCEHLSPDQQEELYKVLSKFQYLFSGKRGHYPHKKVHLNLRKDAMPPHKRAYSVPKSNMDIFKTRLQISSNTVYSKETDAQNGPLQHLSFLKRTAEYVGSLIFEPSTNISNANLSNASHQRDPGHQLTPVGLKPWQRKSKPSSIRKRWKRSLSYDPLSDPSIIIEIYGHDVTYSRPVNQTHGYKVFV